MTAIQQQLFNDTRLPRRPYCSDDPDHGLKIRQLKTALRRKHIQLNPPKLFFWLALDVDRPGGGLAWEDAYLPCPNWSTVNPENGHAHLVWGLEAPVLTTEAARAAPLRYLDSIRRAYTDLARADKGYAGLVSKNPTHGAWRTFWGHAHLFDLGELAEYVPDLNRYSRRSGEEIERVGIGRNVSLFETVRHWSYKEIRLFRGAGRRHFDVWHEHVRSEVEKRNGDFTDPLPYSEIKSIAKSIAKWTWQQDPAAEAKFKKRQSERGQKGGIASGAARAAANENKRATARIMASKGMTQRAIAKELGVSVGSVNAWVRSAVDN